MKEIKFNNLSELVAKLEEGCVLHSRFGLSVSGGERFMWNTGENFLLNQANLNRAWLVEDEKSKLEVVVKKKEAELEQAKIELAKLTGGARPTHELVMVDEASYCSCVGCCFAVNNGACGYETPYLDDFWGDNCELNESIWKVVEIKR